MNIHIGIKFLLFCIVCLSTNCQSEENGGEKEEINHTQYEIETEKSHVDFSHVLNELGELSSSDASDVVIQEMTRSLHERMSKMFEKATSAKCRAKIAEHFGHWIEAIGGEKAALPFTNARFVNQCPEPPLNFENLPKNMTLESLMKKKYQPPRNEAEYIDDPAELKILYGILMHGDAKSTIRLIESLYEEGHSFVIHVDGKESNDESFRQLTEYASSRSYVYLIPNHRRIRVNWGAFSMVNATLQVLQYSFAMIEESELSFPLDFHKFVHLSSTTYPLKSNIEIRNKLASYPLDANMMYLVMKPFLPHPDLFYYYVECDDAVHRIYRLPPLAASTHGVDMYTSSQWFVISRDFAEYLAKAERGTFVHDYIQYSQHMVVADETFFGTVLQNSEFCTTHHNDNFHFLQFDRWESEVEGGERDERKCLSPDPNRCGRSPTTLSKEDFFAMELSDQLFARKFDPNDEEVCKMIDEKRFMDVSRSRDLSFGNHTEPEITVDTEFQGFGTLIAAKETLDSDNPLCLGLGNNGHYVRLVPCFHEVVVPTLSKGWAIGGAVIEQEVLPNNRWEVGPCSSDGGLQWSIDTAELISTPGNHTSSPHCLIKQLKSSRHGRCLDIQDERLAPGARLQVFPCLNKWHQMFGFGNGLVSPTGSIHGSIPQNILRNVQKKDKDQPSHLCVGVAWRGDERISPWSDSENKFDLKGIDFVPFDKDMTSYLENDKIPPLSLWQDKYLMSIPCSDEKAVIHFVFVPFIEEDLGNEEIENEQDQGGDEL